MRDATLYHGDCLEVLRTLPAQWLPTRVATLLRSRLIC
jgi:hypothetical protein